MRRLHRRINLNQVECNFCHEPFERFALKFLPYRSLSGEVACIYGPVWLRIKNYTFTLLCDWVSARIPQQCSLTTVHHSTQKKTSLQQGVWLKISKTFQDLSKLIDDLKHNLCIAFAWQSATTKCLFSMIKTARALCLFGHQASRTWVGTQVTYNEVYGCRDTRHIRPSIPLLHACNSERAMGKILKIANIFVKQRTLWEGSWSRVQTLHMEKNYQKITENYFHGFVMCFLCRLRSNHIVNSMLFSHVLSYLRD